MRFLPLFALLVLAGCAATPRPAPQRPSVPKLTQLPAPLPAVKDWRDLPVTPGDWRYAPRAGGSIALFGPAGQPLFAIYCERADRRVTLARLAPLAGAMTVRTTSQTRTLPVRLAGTPPTQGVAVLGADDRLLDAIGFSRGRFVVDQPGAAALVMPAWAEVERVVEDCRG